MICPLQCTEVDCAEGYRCIELERSNNNSNEDRQ